MDSDQDIDELEEPEHLVCNSSMNWKYVRLFCPHCQFEHSFKRQCWWEVQDVYIGLYGGDDMKSRRDCRQSLIFGEGIYEPLQALLEKEKEGGAKE